MSSPYIQWISDITIIIIVLLCDIILTTITFRKLCRAKKDSNSVRVQLCIIFTTMVLVHSNNLLRLVALPIFGDSIPSQQPVCDALNALGIIFYTTNNLAIITFFINRLSKLFANSQFRLSRCFYYFYLIFFGGMWCIPMTIGSAMLVQNHIPPTNIFTATADTNGNGVSCTLSGLIHKETKLIMAVIMIAFFSSNVTVCCLFVKKLYGLLKYLSLAKSDNEIQAFKSELINLMKHQTMLITTMVSCSIVSFLLSIVFPLTGQLLTVPNQGITLFIIFLSADPEHFRSLRCDKCSDFCCKCFEGVIVRGLSTNDEKNIVRNMQLEPTENNVVMATRSSQISTPQISTSDGTITRMTDQSITDLNV